MSSMYHPPISSAGLLLPEPDSDDDFEPTNPAKKDRKAIEEETLPEKSDDIAEEEEDDSGPMSWNLMLPTPLNKVKVCWRKTTTSDCLVRPSDTTVGYFEHILQS